ncbi:helix-turn-helix domain-containing protein [Gordonia sp. (in: high G+C Gram-positive bacteria)]|uniref:helix-turn-helix domain-containing protein n=1 Tax=Gordonia sp. (in: high G+C Gram-positive bacteria) TaxID=84139 RepID=UPI003C7095D2
MSAQKRFRGERLRFHGELVGSYAALPNVLARDKRLSDRAGRVALYLYSHSGEWSVSVRSIMHELGKGQDSVVAALDELADLRWIIKQPVKAKASATRVSGYVYHIARRGSPFTDDEVARFGAPIVRGSGAPEPTSASAPDSGDFVASAPEPDSASAPEAGAESAPEPGDNRSLSRNLSSKAINEGDIGAGEAAGSKDQSQGDGDHGTGDDGDGGHPDGYHGLADDVGQWAEEWAEHDTEPADSGPDAYWAEARARQAAEQAWADTIDLTRETIPFSEAPLQRERWMMKTHTADTEVEAWILKRQRQTEAMPDWWLKERLDAGDWQSAVDAGLSGRLLNSKRGEATMNVAAYLRGIIRKETKAKPAVELTWADRVQF